MSSCFNNTRRVFLSVFTKAIAASLFFYKEAVFAQQLTLGQVAQNITYSFYGLAQLITAGAYIGGVGFSLAALLKFKAHKDNPTQIPIGTPVAMLFIGGALLFLPNLFGIAGQTIFGSTGGAGGIYGVTGLSAS